jgi:HEAT repeats
MPRRFLLSLLAALFLIPTIALAQDKKVDASPEHIAELIAQLEGGTMGDRMRAKAAHKELMKIGKPAVPQLVVAAQGKKPWVRVWAGAALGASRDPRAVEPMLKLLEDKFHMVRQISTWHGAGLNKMDARIAPAIVARMGDPNPDVRKWAEKAIRERIKVGTVTGALEELTLHKMPEARTVAYKLLMLHRKEKATTKIAQALKSEERWERRSAATRCLGEGEDFPMPFKARMDLLFIALDDKHEEVRADAVELIAFLMRETADRMTPDVRDEITMILEKKLPALLDAQLPRLRGASLYLLAAGKPEELKGRAMKDTSHAAPVVRAYALRTLARCDVKSKGAQARAVECLNDEDKEVRRIAHQYLEWATGGKFEYDHAAKAGKRRKAIKKIRVKLGFAGKTPKGR